MTPDENITEEILREALAQIKCHDMTGIFTVALTLIGRIPERKNWMDLYVADALLEVAVAQEIAGAKDYLSETWPGLRENFVDRIQRQKS